jgi:hypothetical protein
MPSSSDDHRRAALQIVDSVYAGLADSARLTRCQVSRVLGSVLLKSLQEQQHAGITLRSSCLVAQSMKHLNIC